MVFFETRFKLNRTLSIILVFLVLIIIGSLISTYIAPIAQSQFANLVANIPKMVDWAQQLINYWQANQTIIPDEVNQTSNNFAENMQTHIQRVHNYLFGVIAWLLSFIAPLVLVRHVLFFMLNYRDKLVPFITQIFSKKKADNIRSLLHKIDDTLASFIQGQLIVSFVLGILLFIGYALIGLNYSLTLALFGMIMNVVPFIVPFIAVILTFIIIVVQVWMMVVCVYFT